MLLIPNENTQFGQKTSKPVGAIVPYLFIFTIALLVCTGIQLKYKLSINELKSDYAKQIHQESSLLADKIESQFQIPYQGLKTIAQMPSIRHLYTGKNQPALAQPGAIGGVTGGVTGGAIEGAIGDTQEIYAMLRSLTQLTEIHILPKDFEPDQIDPKTGANYIPTFTLNENISDGELLRKASDSTRKNLEESQTLEYREMAQHLIWMRNNVSNEKDINKNKYPALISKEIITFNNIDFSFADTNDQNRMRLIYSVPFYMANGPLAGSIVGVFLTKNLTKLIPNDNYILYNANVDFKVLGLNTNHLLSSLPWIGNKESNHNHIYSNNIRLTIPDSQGDWRLWVGSQDDEFWKSSPVLSAKRFSIMAQIATLLLTISLAIMIRMHLRQGRFSKGQNAVLEYKVSQHGLALEQSEAKFSSVLVNAAQSIIIIDSKGIIETFNKAAESTFGYRAEEIIGQPMGNLLPGLTNKHPSLYVEKYRGLVNAKTLNKQHELLGVHKDNTTFFAELHLNELSFSDMTLYTCIIRDISASKLAEQATQTAKEDAEQSSRTKSEFLANMSHELRTPLNAIIGYCELLIDETEQTGNLEYASDLNNIHTSGHHLLNLINSILDLSKIEAGKMELYLEHFDLKRTIEEAVLKIQPLSVKNNNNILLDISNNLGQMYADTTKVQQIVLNLLGNANKFTKNGEISIYVEQIVRHGVDWLQVHITDTGIGMSPEQLHTLFTEFTQGDSSTTKKYGGTGLGLTITQQFCEMMGGTVRVNSVKEQGSCFVVQLPKAVIEDNIDPTLVRFNNQDGFETARSKISRVLIIGDNKQSTALISSFLLREGFYTDLTHSVAHAISFAKETPPDLVVVDENSVQMNELFDINAIKQSPELKDLPLVMLTKSENQDLASAIGVKDFLPKPIQRNRILDVVFKYVRKNSNTKASDSYILVVEDDLNNREVIRRHLESDGLNVRLAANGLEGMAIVKEKQPDLIFLDIVMPEMDGFEFVETLRSHTQWQSIPVIILTAIELSNKQRAILNNHVETILFKTDIEPAAMLGKLRNVIVSHLKSD